MSAEPGTHARYELGEHGGVRVSVRLVELRGDDARRLRYRQLETIVRLLRRAAGQSADPAARNRTPHAESR